MYNNYQKNTLYTNDDESMFIKIRMQKVQHDVLLPISLLFDAKPEIILKKYLNNDSGRIFPQYSNQFVNRSLKIIAVMAGINKKLTFHIARHTFGTMLAELTQNPYLIMDLMGHADIKTSMIYIHNSQERINRQLKNINWH